MSTTYSRLLRDSGVTADEAKKKLKAKQLGQEVDVMDIALPAFDAAVTNSDSKLTRAQQNDLQETLFDTFSSAVNVVVNSNENPQSKLDALFNKGEQETRGILGKLGAKSFDLLEVPVSRILSVSKSFIVNTIAPLVNIDKNSANYPIAIKDAQTDLLKLGAKLSSITNDIAKERAEFQQRAISRMQAGLPPEEPMPASEVTSTVGKSSSS